MKLSLVFLFFIFGCAVQKNETITCEEYVLKHRKEYIDQEIKSCKIGNVTCYFFEDNSQECIVEN